MNRRPYGLVRWVLVAALTAIVPSARAQDEAASVPAALPMPDVSPQPPASGQARLGTWSASRFGGGLTVASGTLIGCGGCGGIHGAGHGCSSLHELGRSYLLGRRLVRFWGGCAHPLPPLSGPGGYWDSPGSMAEEGIVPGAAIDQALVPIGPMGP